jgi:hypothetical protein
MRRTLAQQAQRARTQDAASSNRRGGGYLLRHTMPVWNRRL